MQTDYIFGYGSLINAESRARTGYTGEGIPVRVHGVQRSWSQTSPRSRMTTVGVHFEENRSCNGVIFPVLSEDLPLFDQRESNYNRKELDPDTVGLLENHEMPQGRIWIYLSKNSGTPSEECPLVQSYVDVCLSGCLQINEAFAHEFIETTNLWSACWIDDRRQPRYRRFMDEIPWATKIDKILQNTRPPELLQA